MDPSLEHSAKSKSIHTSKPKAKVVAIGDVPIGRLCALCGISLRTLRLAFELRSHLKGQNPKTQRNPVVKSDRVDKIIERLLTVSLEESYSSAFPVRHWKSSYL
jgi:hypothetical protein